MLGLYARGVSAVCGLEPGDWITQLGGFPWLCMCASSWQKRAQARVRAGASASRQTSQPPQHVPALQG